MVEAQVKDEYRNEAEASVGTDIISRYVIERRSEIVHAVLGVRHPPLKEVSGRFELRGRSDPRLYIRLDKWIEWLDGQNKSLTEAEREALRLGHVMNYGVIDLMGGTGFAPHRAKCVLFVLDAVTGAIAKEELNKVGPQKVPRLRLIKSA